MKAVSEIIAMFLVLIIAVSLIAMLYLWSTGVLPQLYSGVNETNQYARSRACLNIEYVAWHDGYLVIKNCGLTPLKDFKLYINGNNVSTRGTPAKLDPQEQGGMQINSSFSPSDSYDIFVTADLAESPVVTVTQ